MAVDRAFIMRSLKRIVEDEEAVSIRELSEVDAMFIKAGHGGGSSPWTMERQRVIQAGVERAGARIVVEVRERAGQEAPKFADDAGTWTKTFADRFVQADRGSSDERGKLAQSLSRAIARVVDDLRHRPVTFSTGRAAEEGPEITLGVPGANVRVKFSWLAAWWRCMFRGENRRK